MKTHWITVQGRSHLFINKQPTWTTVKTSSKLILILLPNQGISALRVKYVIFKIGIATS